MKSKLLLHPKFWQQRLTIQLGYKSDCLGKFYSIKIKQSLQKEIVKLEHYTSIIKYIY